MSNLLQRPRFEKEAKRYSELADAWTERTIGFPNDQKLIILMVQKLQERFYIRRLQSNWILTKNLKNNDHSLQDILDASYLVSASCKQRLLGNLSNDNDDGNENVTFDYYFNSLNLNKNGELPRNQIGRRGVRFKKEIWKFSVVCQRSTQNLEFGHFTLLF